MGYTTGFDGEFTLDTPLKDEHREYLQAFKETRRMQRDPEKAKKLPDPKRDGVGLDVGVEGGYFVGAEGNYGQDRDESVVEYNHPPGGQPGLWCQWEPDDEGTTIRWDGQEKFYNYVEWIEYLITHFLKPWGYTLNGEVEWQGENHDDFGKIDVVANVVTTRAGKRVYE